MLWDAASFRARVLEQPVAPRVSRGEIASELDQRYSFREALPLDEVIDDVDRFLLTGNLHTTHPRYFGLFNPTVHEASVVADTIVAAANPQAGAWFHSPAAVEIEAHVLRFFARKFGLPESYAAHFQLPVRAGVKAVWNLDAWLRDAFRKNKPYDQFVRELVTAQGSTWRNGAAVI